MATLTENMLTVNMLLSLFFLPGALADDCGKNIPALWITTPNNMEALTGSCLQIPCTYETKDPKYDNSKTIYGIWMKGGVNYLNDRDNVIFDSRGSINIFSLNITGNLKEKNCTTLFPNLTTNHTDKYFFRVENGEYKASACADPLQITVRDSPRSPSINISGDDLKEHQSVTVTCSAFTPCPHSPPELTWNLQQDSLRQTEKNTDGTFTTKIQESITLSDTHDGYNISCSARYPVIGGIKTAETEVTLSVSYAPKETSASISPSGLVSAGSWVELSCSSRAKPPPRFTWFWISEHGDINVSVEQIYSFNVTEGGEYYCVATNRLGNETSSVILIITKGVKLLVPVIVGIIVVICFLVFLVVFVWYFMFKYSAAQKTQSQMGIDLGVQNPAFEQEEELHYGEVKVTSKTPTVSLNPAEDIERQETVYAQVNVSTPENPPTQADGGPENYYTEVKKK